MKQSIKRAFRTLAALAILGASYIGTTSEVDAASATSSFTVSTTVVQSCTFAASDLTLPNYQNAGPAVSGSTSFSIDCGGLDAVVSLNMTPLTGTVTGTTWRMSGPGGSGLDYSLCLDAGCSQAFDNGSNIMFTQPGASTTKQVFATIPGSQTSNPGGHSQQIQATLIY